MDAYLPENEDAPFFLMVYTSGECCWRVKATEEQKLDAAVTDYLESGNTRNKLIELESLGGSMVKVPLGEIIGWIQHSITSFLVTQHQEHAITERIRQEIPDFNNE